MPESTCLFFVNQRYLRAAHNSSDVIDTYCPYTFPWFRHGSLQVVLQQAYSKVCRRQKGSGNNWKHVLFPPSHSLSLSYWTSPNCWRKGTTPTTLTSRRGSEWRQEHCPRTWHQEDIREWVWVCRCKCALLSMDLCAQMFLREWKVPYNHVLSFKCTHLLHREGEKVNDL